MIVSRIQAHPDYFGDRVGYLVSRAAAITLPTAHGPIHVIGAYVPSRDASVEKTERKRKWLAACTAALASPDHSQPTIFLGDLNVIEPDHQPRYRFFAPFEYAFYRQLTDDSGLIDSPRHHHEAGLLVLSPRRGSRSPATKRPPPDQGVAQSRFCWS